MLHRDPLGGQSALRRAPRFEENWQEDWYRVGVRDQGLRPEPGQTGRLLLFIIYIHSSNRPGGKKTAHTNSPRMFWT